MSVGDEQRQQARATWAAGDWDRIARRIAPVGALVVERANVEPGVDLLDVGCGSGGNVAIPAAQLGATVVGVDITPELLERAHHHGAAAGVSIEWVEADAQDLPFADASFDRVTSTFGAMFAPDHARAAAELVRVCRPGGRIVMTTWTTDGYAGEMFKLGGAFMPPPPDGVQGPALWGAEAHVREMFGQAGATVEIARETVHFEFASEEDAVAEYTGSFGPYVTARGILEPQGRWDEFVAAFADIVHRFNGAQDGGASIASQYFVLTVSPSA